MNNYAKIELHSYVKGKKLEHSNLFELIVLIRILMTAKYFNALFSISQLYEALIDPELFLLKIPMQNLTVLLNIDQSEKLILIT